MNKQTETKKYTKHQITAYLNYHTLTFSDSIDSGLWASDLISNSSIDDALTMDQTADILTSNGYIFYDNADLVNIEDYIDEDQIDNFVVKMELANA